MISYIHIDIHMYIDILIIINMNRPSVLLATLWQVLLFRDAFEKKTCVNMFLYLLSTSMNIWSIFDNICNIYQYTVLRTYLPYGTAYSTVHHTG